MSTPSIRELIDVSYKPQKQAADELSKYGWNYDTELSRMDTKVFTDSAGQPVILHRGSTRVSDWLPTNAALAVGLEDYTSRFKHGKEITQKAKEKYNKPVTTISHSLGGSIAEKSGADKIITYNKPITLFDIGKTIPSNQTDIRTTYDPVSLLSQFQFGNKIEVPSTSIVTAHKPSSLPENIMFY